MCLLLPILQPNVKFVHDLHLRRSNVLCLTAQFHSVIVKNHDSEKESESHRPSFRSYQGRGCLYNKSLLVEVEQSYM